MLWSFFLVQPLNWSLPIVVENLLFIAYYNPIGKWFKHSLIKLFHLSNLLQITNDYRMVNLEFFGNFSCSYKISFNDPLIWSLSTSNGQPLHSSSSRLSSPLQNLLSPHCTVCSLAVLGPNALFILRVVFAALRPILNSNKKIVQVCFLSNSISIVLINSK